ncbi:hypothetical protein [Aquimarina litoralis]|uniref:hypothetical protein n=1 Tax=Aquimarina litoralis TaxID=584605 RepID=UPI001C5995BF|nr:hypothetical protein [Aquimarina litoralis]MBW1297791.1 hypothetical protein [Aquimarina litoralis]
MSSIIVILIAYWYDYKSNKKQFVSDSKGGLFFVVLLLNVFGLLFLILDVGILISVLSMGIALPGILFIKYFIKKLFSS